MTTGGNHLEVFDPISNWWSWVVVVARILVNETTFRIDVDTVQTVHVYKACCTTQLYPVLTIFTYFSGRY